MPIEGYPNLINPATDRTTDERRESATKAGKASGEARRRKKTFAAGLRAILDMPARDPQTLEALKALGLEGTVRDVLNLAQIKQAEKGDADAYRLVRDTVGEKPREGLEIGNLDDKPFESLDLTKLSDEQLRELAARKAESHE